MSEWPPEAFTQQAFSDADWLPVGQKDGGVSCKQDAESAQSDDAELTSGEGVRGGIQNWRDKWGEGRWMENTTSQDS